ncbi:Zinc finger, C3HC4 type (RING finger) containing protein, putative [Leishmania lindenbergi]|uniref:Zinc finger, C3HC4 type (RING finger) containing protein n=1 Tax=Leishmania lindenbergi TaxID=651832 RepID=A0AAW3ANM1_9TRYP
MSGLELIALVPIGIAGWKLFQKLGDQQNLIAQHELTINRQKEMLDSIVNADRASLLKSPFHLAVAAGTLVLAGTVTYKSWTLTKSPTIRPPPNYEPTQSTFDAEQCVICLENCKDTVFLPCRHLCTCWSCASRIGNNSCPTCRAPLEAMQFVYQQ